LSIEIYCIEIYRIEIWYRDLSIEIYGIIAKNS